jgi:hypothetical protein
MGLFPPSDEGRETSTLQGPLERANLNHWTPHVEGEVEVATDGQSAGVSSCRAPTWSLWPGFLF